MRLFLAFVAFVLGTGAAQAQWMLTKEDDAFEGDLHIAMSAEWGGYFAGFRCREGKPPSLIFITPEQPEADTLAGMQQLPTNIVVVVDDKPKVAIGAELDANSVTGKLMAMTFEPEVVGVIFAAKDAKRRVSFGLEFMGKVFHSKSFKPGGTSRAIGGLIDRCKIVPPSPE